MSVTVLKVQKPEEARPATPGVYKLSFSKLVTTAEPPTGRGYYGSAPFKREVVEVEAPVAFTPGHPGFVDVRLSWDSAMTMTSARSEWALVVGACDLQCALKAAIACAE